MGKVKKKKPDGGNPLGGIKLPDTAKAAPKELVQNALDDGTMRIVSQLRDATQRDQQEECSGSQIENAALDVSRMTARGVEAFARSKVETLLHPGKREEDAPQEEQSEQDSVQKTGEDAGHGSTQESSAALSQETPPETVQELAQETPFTTETDTPHSTEEPVPESAGTFPEQSATSATQEQSPPTEQGRMESPKEPPTFGETFSSGEAAQPAVPLQSGETTVTETPVETSDRSEKRRKHHMEQEPVPEKKEETWKPAYQDVKPGQHGSTGNAVHKDPADGTETVSDDRGRVRTHGSGPAQRLEQNQKSPRGRDVKSVGGQPEVRDKGRKPVAQQDTAANLGRQKLIREKGKAAESKTVDASWRETGAMQTVTLENHPARTPPGYTLNDGFSDVVPSAAPSYTRPSTMPDVVRHEKHPVEYQIPVGGGQPERNQPEYERPGIRTRTDTTQGRNSPDLTEKEKVSVKSGEAVKTRESMPQEYPVSDPDTPQKMSAADCGKREFIRERGREIRPPEVDSADSVPHETHEKIQRHDVPENPEMPPNSNVRSYPPTVHHQTGETAVQTANLDITERAGIVKNKPIPTMNSGKPSSATVPVSATSRKTIAPEQETMPVKTREAYVQRENPSAQAVTHPAETASQTAEQGKAKAIRDAGQRTTASRAGGTKSEQNPNVSRTENPIPVSSGGKQPEIVHLRQAQAVPSQEPDRVTMKTREPVLSAPPVSAPSVDRMDEPRISFTQDTIRTRQTSIREKVEKPVEKRTDTSVRIPQRGNISASPPIAAVHYRNAVKQKELTVKGKEDLSHNGNTAENFADRRTASLTDKAAGHRIVLNPATAVRTVRQDVFNPAQLQPVSVSQPDEADQEQKSVRTRENNQRNVIVPAGGVAPHSGKQKAVEPAQETGLSVPDSLNGNPMDSLCPASEVSQNDAFPVQAERLALPESSAEGTAFANHGESSVPAPSLARTENLPSASDVSVSDQLAKPQTVRELQPMSREHLQESMPEGMPIKTREAYVQRQKSGTETAAGRPGQGRPRTAQEFARNTGNHGEQAVTADIKTREAVLQAQTQNAQTVSQRGPEYAHQESARETPGSQIQESPRELRKTVRTREGLIEEPKPAAGEYGSEVNASANVRGSDIAETSRDDLVHGSRIESGDTGTALPHPDAPASLTTEQRTPDIKTRSAYTRRENQIREEPSSRTVEQGRQRFVRERKRQADRKLAAEHGSGIADKGILDDGTAVTEETRAIAAEQETRIQGLKTKEAWLRQHGLDRPRERIADIHSGKNAAGPAGRIGFPVSLSGQDGANLKGKIPELPPADTSHFPVKSAAETGRFIREKGAAAVRNTVSSGGKAVKAVRPVVIKEAGKTGSKAIKTAEQTAEKGVRTAARESAKMAQKAAQAAKASAKAKAVKDAAVKAAKQGVRTIKDVGKAVAAAAKAAIAALSSLLAGLSASSIVVAVILVVICLIGLLVATPFGLFLSGQTGVGDDNIQAAVSRLTGEYNARLQEIQEDIPHDELDMAPDIVSAMTGNWKNVLAVYAVRVTTDEFSATEVVTMTDEKMEILRETFWDMNAISYRTTRRTEGSGEDAVTIVTLHISPDTKDAEDMAEEYHFNAKQKKLLEELLSPEYDELFDALLSGNHALVPGDLDGVLIPGDISETRRQIVETGSQLIGQVHYFWGGKSLVLGWDSRWGTPTRVWAAGSPSTGTVRPYGLDCSGYVDWVFYNVSGGTYVIGHGGGASAQHSYCTPISWAEAQPGDLAFYPGDSHVGIIVGYDEAGNVKIMHCASGSQNGVSVTNKQGFVTCGRPRYLE